MSRRPAEAIVALAALDLRAAPDHKSELRSQLLLGERVRVLSISNDRLWWRVENMSDRYRGWIRNWGVVGASAGRAARWEQRARARVAVSYAEVTSQRGGGALVSPVFWQGRLIVGRRSGRWHPVELPDGRRGWIESAALALASAQPRKLVDRIRSLLGVPYLWGGRTPLGLDCSGFCQLVLAEQGIRIPRDADDQHAVCAPVRSAAESRLGDLIFFGPHRGRIGHVALTLGAGYYVHSRGWVRIASLEPGNPLFDSQLLAQVRAFGRPRKRSTWRLREGRKPRESA